MDKNIEISELLALKFSKLEKLVISELKDSEVDQIFEIGSQFGLKKSSTNHELFHDVDWRLMSRALYAWIDVNLMSANQAIYKKICIEFDYCEKRNSGEFDSDNILITSGITDILLTIVSIIPISTILSLVVLIVRSKYLDQICDCQNLTDRQT